MKLNRKYGLFVTLDTVDDMMAGGRDCSVAYICEPCLVMLLLVGHGHGLCGGKSRRSGKTSRTAAQSTFRYSGEGELLIEPRQSLSLQFK